MIARLAAWWRERKRRQERQRRFEAVQMLFIEHPELAERLPTKFLIAWINDDKGMLTLSEEDRKEES